MKKQKNRPITYLIVTIITLTSMLCSIILMLFTPTLSLNTQAIMLRAQGRYTEAANSYQQMITEMNDVQEKVTGWFDFSAFRGVDYHFLRTYARISRSGAGSYVNQNFLPEDLAKFPQSKFAALAEMNKEYTSLSGAFNQIMEPFYHYYETGAGEYLDVDRDYVFEKLDEYISKNPKAPLWFLAILQNYVGELTEELADIRLNYFKPIMDSNEGIEQFSVYLAPLLRELNMHDTLIDIYNRRLRINRNDFEAILGLGREQMVIGDERGFKRTLARAERDGGDSGVYEALGIEQLRREKKYSEALALYADYSNAQYAKNSDANPEVTRQAAIVLLLTGELESAMETSYEAALAMVNNSGQSEYTQAAIYLLALVVHLTEDKQMMKELSLNQAGYEIINAEDRQKALEELFLNGRGDIA
ncbi:MAG: hypothetical protein FWG82_02080 [Oscillospiraceae bacterium]|nr:hypothetical protein [Oscillospiraceae bacterium]